MLLDESTEPARDHTDEERLTQVWFAGAHSNVGGGYPDDSIAFVPLLWMADEAQERAAPAPAHYEGMAGAADPNGPVIDSRRGIGSYYRYNPRSNRSSPMTASLTSGAANEDPRERVQRIRTAGTTTRRSCCPNPTSWWGPAGARRPVRSIRLSQGRVAPTGAGLESRVVAPHCLFYDRDADGVLFARPFIIDAMPAA